MNINSVPFTRMEDEDLKRATFISSGQQRILWYTKIVCAGLLFISGAVAIGLVIGIPETFEYELLTTSDYRDIDGPVLADNYPDVAFENIGTADVGLIAAFASLIAGLVLALNVFAFHGAEMVQLSRGANPWFWGFSAAWTPVAFLAIQYFAGIHNVFVHTLMAFLVWGWIFLFYADDLLNSNAYIASQREFSTSAVFDSLNWSWITLVFGILLALAVYAVLFIYTGFTFSADPGPESELIAIPIAVGAAYLLLIPVPLALYRAGVLIRSLFAREMVFYIASGIVALLTTWLSLGLIASANHEAAP